MHPCSRAGQLRGQAANLLGFRPVPLDLHHLGLRFHVHISNRRMCILRRQTIPLVHARPDPPAQVGQCRMCRRIDRPLGGRETRWPSTKVSLVRLFRHRWVDGRDQVLLDSRLVGHLALYASINQREQSLVSSAFTRRVAHAFPHMHVPCESGDPIRYATMCRPTNADQPTPRSKPGRARTDRCTGRQTD